MDNYQKAWIVMQEYNTIRSEIIALYTGLIQTAVVEITILIALTTYGVTHDFTRAIISLIAISVISCLAMEIFILSLILKLCTHLRGIEQRINESAREILLTWETQKGLSAQLERAKNRLCRAPQSK